MLTKNVPRSAFDMGAFQIYDEASLTPLFLCPSGCCSPSEVGFEKSEIHWGKIFSKIRVGDQNLHEFYWV